MPRATVDQSPGEHIELETCEGAYVVLKRMSYGQKQLRQQLAMKMSFELDRSGNRQQRRSKSTKADMELLSMASTLFDFRTCIVEHNLEDETGRTLNLSQEADVQRLDPRIGEELSMLIDELNNFEKDLNNEEGDFSNESERLSS
jgi:hypothetical protein